MPDSSDHDATGAAMPAPVSPRKRGGAAKRSEDIYESLKTDIASMQVKPGDALFECDIADRYSASRTPVREALLRLVKEGLVEKVGRTNVVSSFSVDDVVNLYEIREALECLAVRLAVERATVGDLEELAEIIESMRQSREKGRVEAYLAFDRNFHLAIARMARNPFLESELRSIQEKVRMIQSQWRSRVAKFPNLHNQHERIHDAIRRRDASIAQAEIRYHMQEFVSSMRALDTEE